MSKMAFGCLQLFTPDFKIGVTLPSLQMSGNVSFSKDDLNTVNKGFATRSPTSLTTVVGISSRPAASLILDY